MAPINIGIVGLGTVGAGTVNVLQRNAVEISRRAGREIKVIACAVRDTQKQRHCDLAGISITADPFEVVANPQVDIVVELMGGCETAKDVILKAFDLGKHVVTANKALIAEHGHELFAKAEQSNRILAFEAAVGGGIPIIKTIREGLGGNRIQWVAGLINGTANYILTNMQERAWDFETALAQAQHLGYAEADPAFDVEGVDSGHKITILASLAFGIPLNFSEVYMEGIRGISSQDIEIAQQLGYHLKHLAFAKRRDDGIEIRVHPAFIPGNCLLAQVKDVMNAVLVQADAVGPTLYYGAGAGAEATASAVVADLVDVIRVMSIDSKFRVPYLAFQKDKLISVNILKSDDAITRYYLRLFVEDEPGILAKITHILGDKGISIESMIQKRSASEYPHQPHYVPIVMITHLVQERIMKQALKEIAQISGIDDQYVMIRIEDLDQTETKET